MKNKYLASLLGAIALGFLPSLQAVPTLSVTINGGAPILIADGSGSDFIGAAGAVGYTTSVGGWTFTTSTASTYPANGSQTRAQMHLEVTALNSGVGGTVEVLFSEVNYGPITSANYAVAQSATVDVNAPAGTSAVDSTFISLANTQFSTVTPLVSSLTILPGGSGNTQNSALFGPSAAYSLTSRILITAAAGDTRQISAAIDIAQNVPEGGVTMSLLGSAFIALALLRRKLAS